MTLNMFLCSLPILGGIVKGPKYLKNVGGGKS